MIYTPTGDGAASREGFRLRAPAKLEAWAPFLCTVRVRATRGGKTSVVRHVIREVVPVTPTEVSIADLQPVVRFQRKVVNSSIPFSSAADEVVAYSGRLYRRFADNNGHPIIPAIAFDAAGPAAERWERWMVGMVPDAPWHYSRLERFPLLKAPTFDLLVRELGWTDWRVIESDQAQRWSAAHARHDSSVLICGDVVYVATEAPQWVVTRRCSFYYPVRTWEMTPRSVSLADWDYVLRFRDAMRWGRGAVGGKVELCELLPGSFDRHAVEIAAQALQFAAELGAQTTSEQRARGAVAEQYTRMRALYRRDHAPSPAEAPGIIEELGMLHDTLAPLYRSQRYYLQRATNFVDEARLRLAHERERASELSDEDLDALTGW